VGVATHEIGHALGFTSGVDRRDGYPDQDSEDDPRLWASVLDLYRYSASGTRDWGVGGTPYFSIDGGATSLYLFSTGRNHGDGRQASHWKEGGPAIMDPTFASGALGQITALDLRALDVIGWDLTAYAVPEPSGLALAAILLRRRSRGGRLAG
jgi:hypothetical protein